MSRKKQLFPLNQSPAGSIEPDSRSADSNNDASTFTGPLPQQLQSATVKPSSLTSDELAQLHAFFELLSAWDESLNGGNRHE